jgi:putative endonuclease
MGHTNYQTGHDAEKVAADYLRKLGYKIIALNWKVRLCEIDIIASKNSVTFFVEVKFRSTVKQGSGLEYITSKKLAQMQFAAEYWVAHNSYSGECQLAVLELSGLDYTVTNFVTDIV